MNPTNNDHEKERKKREREGGSLQKFTTKAAKGN